jgi:hypothetical protein
MMRALALIITLFVAVPCMAQADLRQWYEAQTPQKQDLLRKRLRALRALKPPARERMLKLAAEGKPILTDEQRENLRKLRELPYLHRVRLYTLARELEMTRRANPAGIERAMQAPEREKALLALIVMQRAQMSLTPEERMQLRAMRPPERQEFLRNRREAAEKEARARITGLEYLQPNIAELRKAAETDPQARRELRQAMHDLGTLDMLQQRLSLERREKVQAEIKDMNLERAAQRVQRELNAHWQSQRGEREKRPRDDMRPGDRKAMPHREDRPRNGR